MYLILYMWGIFFTAFKIPLPQINIYIHDKKLQTFSFQ